jgi:hypothetical protein
MADEIASLSVRALGERYRSNALSPRDVLAASLARIEEFEDRVNAFAFIDREGAESAAAESEARWMRGEPLGPLDGVPATVKDIMYVKGWITTYGSRVMALDEPAAEDSPAVARLREAGAVLIGMTNTPEIGWKGHTDSPAHGITHRAAEHRHRWRRVDPHPRLVQRTIRLQGQRRPRAGLAGQRLRQHGPYRPDHPHGRGRRPYAECADPPRQPRLAGAGSGRRGLRDGHGGRHRGAAHRLQPGAGISPRWARRSRRSIPVSRTPDAQERSFGGPARRTARAI